MDLCELVVWVAARERHLTCLIDGRPVSRQAADVEIYDGGAWQPICHRCARRQTRYLWMMGEPRTTAPGRN